jgi:hypothetical protein
LRAAFRRVRDGATSVPLPHGERHVTQTGRIARGLGAPPRPLTNMTHRFLPILSLLLLPPLAANGSPQGSAAVPGAEGQPRLLEPGPRWTGRWIVHVDRDPAEHRAALATIGALRRARDRDGLAAFIAGYDARMSALR